MAAAPKKISRSRTMAETVEEATRILDVEAYWKLHTDRDLPAAPEVEMKQAEEAPAPKGKGRRGRKPKAAPKKRQPVKKGGKKVEEVIQEQVVKVGEASQAARASVVAAARGLWGDNEANVNVLYLAEERTESFKMKAATKVLELFKKCEETFKLEINKMRIVVQSPKDGSYRQYDGVDKSVHSRDLTEIGVCPEDTLRLISMMYVFPAEGEALAATKQIENAVFDLFWGYPPARRDYLDGTCLVYGKDNKFISAVDYSHRNFACLEHSGDVMNDASRQGHHTIKVNLTKITEDMQTFYFVLSAWSSTHVSEFIDPTVMLYDVRDKSQELCPPYVKHFNTPARALILCALTRSETEGAAWDVIALGKTCPGNAMNYEPIKKAITDECYAIVSSHRHVDEAPAPAQAVEAPAKPVEAPVQPVPVEAPVVPAPAAGLEAAPVVPAEGAKP